VDELTPVAADEPPVDEPFGAPPETAPAVPETAGGGAPPQEAAAPAAELVASLATEELPAAPASFEDDTMSWNGDDDPFASLGPAEEPEGRD
jgi:hypothetical protein